jgi:Immunoglobulin domain
MCCQKCCRKLQFHRRFTRQRYFFSCFSFLTFVVFFRFEISFPPKPRQMAFRNSQQQLFLIDFESTSHTNHSVSVMPYIKPFEFEGPASAGDSIQLSCHITKGDPPFTIEWFFDGEPITPHFGVLTGMFGHRSNILSISQVRPVNRGRYTCSVSNPAGRAIFSADLLVNGTQQTHTPIIRCTNFSVSLYMLNGTPR